MLLMQLDDTTPDAREKQLELLRAMSPSQRAEIMTGLTFATQRLAFLGMRERYPDASDDEIWLRLAAQRLGPDIVRRIYGFDAEDP